MTEDEAVCSGSDRQVDTGMIDSEGVDADNTFLCSDSGTIFMHEDAREDVEGVIGVIGRLDSGSGSATSSVHEGVTIEVVGGKDGEIGVIEVVNSRSNSGTTSVHEDASEAVRGIGSEVCRVIGGMVSGSGLSSLSIAESKVFRDSECDGEWENKEGKQLSDVSRNSEDKGECEGRRGSDSKEGSL